MLKSKAQGGFLTASQSLEQLILGSGLIVPKPAQCPSSFVGGDCYPSALGVQGPPFFLAIHEKNPIQV